MGSVERACGRIRSGSGRMARMQDLVLLTSPPYPLPSFSKESHGQNHKLCDCQIGMSEFISLEARTGVVGCDAPRPIRPTRRSA